MYHAKGNKEGPGLHQAAPIQKGNHKATTSTVKIMLEFKRNMQGVNILELNIHLLLPHGRKITYLITCHVYC